MNFLLHRELALHEIGAPAAGVGAMLPDLWRMADRRVRAGRQRGHEANLELGQGASSTRALARGVAHHLEADRWFHATEIFVAGERATTATLSALGVPKLGRFGHIGWELCLDGALLLDRDFDAFVGGLRRDLDGLDTVSLADAHGASALDAAARSRFHLRMDRIVEGLAEGDWIGGYRRGPGLAERLEGVRRRVGLGALDERARRALAEALARRLDAACVALPDLFAARQREAS